MTDEGLSIAGDVSRADLEAHLESYLQDASNLDPEAEEYLRDGSPRTVDDLTADEQDLVEAIERAVEAQPKACYKNCQLAAAEWDEVAYVEGYTMSARVPVPLQHAWVELNGKVVEITLPSHLRGELNAYYGKPFDSEVVRHTLYAREEGSPLAASDDLRSEPRTEQEVARDKGHLPDGWDEFDPEEEVGDLPTRARDTEGT